MNMNNVVLIKLIDYRLIGLSYGVLLTFGIESTSCHGLSMETILVRARCLTFWVYPHWCYLRQIQSRVYWNIQPISSVDLALITLFRPITMLFGTDTIMQNIPTFTHNIVSPT